MIPNSILPNIGNACVGVAALIYALPLQHLLFELSRKRDEGGSGALVGILLLAPMWLLLLGALLCVTALGGFDGLVPGRTALYFLAPLTVLSMTVLSFMRFEFPRHPKFTTRFVGGLPIHVFPLVTMLLAVVHLNPRLQQGLPLPFVRTPWLVCAALSLALCGGFVGYRFSMLVRARLLGFASRFRHRGPSDREILAQISHLDPKHDFAELLKRTNEYESRGVRTTALARLRADPDFVPRLTAELATRCPEHALAAVDFASFSPEELQHLALPTRKAMERITHETRKEFRYIPKDRRKRMRRWGNRLLASLATKFQGTNVDFQPAVLGFDETFTLPEKDLE